MHGVSHPGVAVIIGVSNTPGAIETTRMPKRPNSLAAGNVIAAIPPLDAAYAVWPIWPSKAAAEAVVTITPRSPSASGSLFCMKPAARRSTLNVPTRLTSTTRRKAFKSQTPWRPRIRSACRMPTAYDYGPERTKTLLGGGHCGSARKKTSSVTSAVQKMMMLAAAFQQRRLRRLDVLGSRHSRPRANQPLDAGRPESRTAAGHKD